jgi:hypothetical protein
LKKRLVSAAAAACIIPGAALLGSSSSTAAPVSAFQGPGVLQPGAIQNIMVIDVENEGFAATFQTAGTYIHDTLEKQGELVQNYYATGHVSLDNYIAQVSGQAPNYQTSSDCIGAAGAGAFNDLQPGVLDANQALYPGQVDGTGCVYPSSVQTIGGQLDAAYPQTAGGNWRVYAEDMGNDPARDGGVADPLGGTDCAHPDQTNGTGTDYTEYAEAADRYAARHDPFVFFHSVIDNPSNCAQDVVPLGTEITGSGGVSYSGHLAQDLSTQATTPRFSFVVPNLCNDGHDSTCAGTNTAGTTTGGLTAANDWLATWMPLVLNSPAYQTGHMLVVLTADEGNLNDTVAGDNETVGPSDSNPGYSPVLNTPIPAYGGYTYYQLLHVSGLTPNVPPAPGTMPGGGQIGALLLNPLYVHDGIVDQSGSYNHYSALRTYEDLLGLQTGGADGQGHLGFASTAHPFGTDVFRIPTSTTLSPSAAPSVVGASVTYTATVSPVADGGTVNFYDGANPICAQVAVTTSGIGAGTATCAATYSSTGSHSITASYGGDSNFQASSTSSTLTQYVDTDLSRFNTKGIYNLGGANLKGAYLGGINLAGVNMSNANLTGVSFRGANLAGANLIGSNLTGDDFTGASLIGVNLSDANLVNTNLTQADLDAAAGMTTSNLKGVAWSSTICPDGTTSTTHGETCLSSLTP